MSCLKVVCSSHTSLSSLFVLQLQSLWVAQFTHILKLHNFGKMFHLAIYLTYISYCGQVFLSMNQGAECEVYANCAHIWTSKKLGTQLFYKPGCKRRVANLQPCE
jgi:hypothetical protein